MDKKLLYSNDIVNLPLTIIHIEKHPSRYTKEMWPYVTFAEFPDSHYEACRKLKETIDFWAKEEGETPDTTDYPKVNDALAETGGVKAYFQWKEGKNHRYVNVILV